MPLLKRGWRSPWNSDSFDGREPEYFVVHPTYPMGLLRIGQLRTGFRDDDQLGATEETWGDQAGAAGVARSDASGPSTPGPRYAEHVGDLREGEAEARALAARAQLERAVEEASPKADLERARAELLREQVADARGRLERRVDERDALRDAVDRAEAQHRELPRSERGIVGSWWLPLLIALAVSTIDVGVLHLAFDHSGVGDVNVWLNTVSIPLAMLGMMFAFGWLAGLIALAVPARHRLRVGIGTLVLSLATVFFGLALLTHFRDLAVDAKNHAFDALKDGGADLSVSQVLRTTFLGPLQGAAVWAGTIAEALYVMGKPGRDAQAETSEVTERWTNACSLVERIEQEIESCQREERAARLKAEEQIAAGAGARAELRSHDELLAAERKAIRGASDAAADRYEMERLIAEQEARNGSVRRSRVRSDLRGRTWVTGTPLLVTGVPAPAPPGNGASPPEHEPTSTNGDS
jgi:hypothetical protein